jgi:hypothetical protein
LITKIDHGQARRVAEGDHRAGPGERAARPADEDREQLTAIDRTSAGHRRLHGNGLAAQASTRNDWIPVMEHQGGAEQESDAAGNRADEQQVREREAFKRRVRESLLRCPGAETSRPA